MTLLHRLAGTLAVAGTTLLLAGCGDDAADRASTPAAGAAATPARTAAGTATDIGGATPFAASSPWNTPAQSLPRAGRSASMIRLAAEQPVSAADRTRLQRRRSSRNLAINLTGWAPGVYRAGRGEPMTLICRQDPCGRPGHLPPATLRLPADLVSDSGHDGWLVIVDEATGTAWDLWRARRVERTVSFEFVREWALDGTGAGTPVTREPDRVPSVRGSGLPMLAGLIRPEELRAGRIPHTLAMSVPGPAATIFVPPAGTTNGLGPQRSLPQGARIRLKASAYERTTRRRARSRGATAVLQALFTYGAIIVDRADAPTLYAQRNADYRGVLAASSLGELGLRDFEVVSLGRVLRDPVAPPPARPSQESR